jgi:limonene 1,2-monooxygenase
VLDICAGEDSEQYDMSHIQGQAQPTFDAALWASKGREEHSGARLKAVAHMTEKYEAERK